MTKGAKPIAKRRPSPGNKAQKAWVLKHKFYGLSNQMYFSEEVARAALQVFSRDYGLVGVEIIELPRAGKRRVK